MVQHKDKLANRYIEGVQVSEAAKSVHQCLVFVILTLDPSKSQASPAPGPAPLCQVAKRGAGVDSRDIYKSRGQ